MFDVYFLVIPFAILSHTGRTGAGKFSFKQLIHLQNFFQPDDLCLNFRFFGGA